jgi:hypothetical protein
MTKPRIRVRTDGSLVMSDGLQNLVAGLGTARDKAAGSAYLATLIDDQTLMHAYRGSWLARKIVDIPAFDACRKWRNWQAEKEQIAAIEAEEKRLDIRRKVMAAKIAARLFGGAALLIGTGEANTAQPLNPERVRRQGLRYVTLLQRRHLSPMEIETDPASPFFDQPRAWRLGAGSTLTPEIHPSRLVIFRGAEIPDRALAYHHTGWADPVLQGVLNAVRDADATAANVASLVFEAKVDTIGIPNLAQWLQDAAGEQALIKRFTLANIAKGINGALMHDKEEIIGQKTASFASLPDVMDRFMQLASGAADIPMTRLFGQAPAGMSATGESDLRNYYDRVSAMQSLEIEPAMAVLDECLIRSALGARPDEVHFAWASLWQTTDQERAAIGKVQADTVKVLRDTGLLPDEALADAAVNMLTESGAMPGLEGAMATWAEEGGEDDTDAAAALGAAPPGVGQAAEGTAVADAAPRTLYISRKVTNAAEILAWAKEQGFKQTLPASELHVTIAYSRKPLDWMKLGEPWEAEIEVAAGGPRLMDRFGQAGDATVLLFNKTALTWRNEEVTRAGGTWDHPEYQPHITIAYGEAPDLAAIVPYRGKIVLGPEIFAEVDENWKAKVTA